MSCRNVIKKRRDHEYKLQKRTKQKEDYLKYIQYEINLLSLLRLRRQVEMFHSLMSTLSTTVFSFLENWIPT